MSSVERKQTFQDEGLNTWQANLFERISPRLRQELRFKLNEMGLSPGRLVLTSSAPLRQFGLSWLMESPSPVIFNHKEVRDILDSLPPLAQILADSIGFQGSLDDLIQTLFEEVNDLGWLLPNQPNEAHFLARLGVFRPEQDHPPMMAWVKAFALVLFLNLAGIPLDQQPIILSIDTINQIRLWPHEAYYYGMFALSDFLGQRPEGQLALDKYQTLLELLTQGQGVAETFYEKIIQGLSGVAQLRSSVGHVFDVRSACYLISPNGVVIADVHNIFAAKQKQNIPNNTGVPGGIELSINGSKNHSPFRHLVSHTLVGGQVVGMVPSLGCLSQAYEDPKRYPQLAEVMMAVRGFPGSSIAGMLMAAGYKLNWSRYLNQISQHPGVWRRPFSDIGKIISQNHLDKL